MVFLCQRLGISFVVTYIPKRKLRISDHRSTNFDTIQIFKQVHFWFMLLSISQPCLLVTVQSSYKINNFLYNNKILQFYTREKMPQIHKQKMTFNKKRANIVAKKTRQINLKHVTHRIGCIFVFITAASKAVSHFFKSEKKTILLILKEKKTSFKNAIFHT